MAKKKPIPEGTNGWDFAIHVVRSLFDFLTRALWPATICFGALCVYWGVAAIAGKTTIANVVANLVANWGLDQIVAYTVGASGVGYGVYQRHQKVTTIKTLRDQDERYERALDPNRTGSGLLRGGGTPNDS